VTARAAHKGDSEIDLVFAFESAHFAAANFSLEAMPIPCFVAPARPG